MRLWRLRRRSDPNPDPQLTSLNQRTAAELERDETAYLKARQREADTWTTVSLTSSRDTAGHNTPAANKKGISSWGRKVGRRLELLTISDGETLTYNVTPSSRPAAYSRSSTPDPGLVLDLNNNPGPGLVPAKQEMRERPEMRERVGRRESRSVSSTAINTAMTTNCGERETFERAEPRVRRKVSRVESLKRILFSRTETEEKKRRSKSAEAELKRTVDKGVGPDSGLSSEDDVYNPRASCLDLTSEIGEFDSVSQISCMDSHDRWHFIRRNGSMSVSSDLLSMQDCDQSTVVSSASKRGQFLYAYLK